MPSTTTVSGRAVLESLGVRWTGRPPATGAGRLRVGDDVVPMPGSTLRAITSRVLSSREKLALGRFLGSLGKRPVASSVSAIDWLADSLSGRALDFVRTLTTVGTYCSDLTLLSADAASSQLALALRGVTYIDGGWQVLVDGLADACRTAGGSVVEHCPVVSVTDTPGGWRLSTGMGEMSARSVVLAAGGPAEAGRVLGRDDLWPDLGPNVTAACLDLDLAVPPPVPVLFSLDDPLYLSQHSDTVVHVMRYGVRSADADRAELAAHAALAGVNVDDARASRFLARMVVAHTAPSPTADGLAGRPGVAVQEMPGVYVAGDWVGDSGLIADASLASASAAARLACVGPRSSAGAAG